MSNKIILKNAFPVLKFMKMWTVCGEGIRIMVEANAVM